MVMTESQRFELHEILREKLGVNAAETLMGQLPPSGWDDLARSHHIESLRSELTTKMTTIHGELASELTTICGELTNKMTTIRGELTSKMSTMHGELLAEMHRLAAVQTRWIAGLLGSLVVAMIVALVR